MKAIIKGRGYVTDNAELLGEGHTQRRPHGPQVVERGPLQDPARGMLLPRRRGQLHDRGWRRRVDSGGWAEGQGIVPMNLKEARECLTTAQVEAAFGDQAIVTGDGSRDVGPGSSPCRVRRRASSRCAGFSPAGTTAARTARRCDAGSATTGWGLRRSKMRCGLGAAVRIGALGGPLEGERRLLELDRGESAAAEGREAQVDWRPNLWRDHGRFGAGSTRFNLTVPP